MIKRTDLHIAFIVPIAGFEYIGLGLLMSCLRAEGFNDFSFLQDDDPQIERLLEEKQNIILSFSSFTTSIERLIDRSTYLKKKYPHALSVFGGPHATFVPDIVYRNGVDAVCIGEGEEAFIDFMKAFCNQDGQLPLNIHNWWVKDKEGTVHKNSLRPIVKDLDSLPFGEKEIFMNSHFNKRGFRRFIFSRGCPNNCKYCLINAFPRAMNIDFAEYFRIRSPRSAVNEIRETVDKYGGKVIGFIDSVFGLDLKWLEEFVRLYKKEVGLPFYCNAEPRMISPEYVRLLKEGGACLVYMGAETGSEDFRSEQLCKDFDNDLLKESVRLLKDAGIKVGLYNMIGLPGGNLDDDLKTLELNQSLQPYMSFCGMFFFFPGTEMTMECCECTYETANPNIIRKGVFPIMEYSEVRKDFKILYRLFYCFDFCNYLQIPIPVVRVIIRLPFERIYQVISFIWRAIKFRRIHK